MNKETHERKLKQIISEMSITTEESRKVVDLLIQTSIKLRKEIKNDNNKS